MIEYPDSLEARMEKGKHWGVFAVCLCLLITLLPLRGWADFDSGSDGSDGALVVTRVDNVNVVTLNGIEIGDKLPLDEDGVFNFTTVNVGLGATLQFVKNARNTPVTILASGDVVIEGTIDVSGTSGNKQIPGLGGPGGFDGGYGGAPMQDGMRGEGPGGGLPGKPYDGNFPGGGGGGSHATVGEAGGDEYEGYGGAGGEIYGNPSLIPLMGGSGGGGGGGVWWKYAGGGGGGGGALLIASSGTINMVSGSIAAHGNWGGNGSYVTSYGCYGGAGGSGSGGAIRLVATTIAGGGDISAEGAGNKVTYSDNPGGSGGYGRIRLEAFNLEFTDQTVPDYTFGIPYTGLPAEMPTLKIQSIAGVTVPDAPQGDLNDPDMVLPSGTQNPISITIQAENVPVETSVSVKALPAVGSAVSQEAVLEGTTTSSMATVGLDVSLSCPSLIIAEMTYDVSMVFNEPVHVNGELVTQISQSVTVDNQQSIVLITESGKEIAVTL